MVHIVYLSTCLYNLFKARKQFNAYNIFNALEPYDAYIAINASKHVLYSMHWRM